MSHVPAAAGEGSWHMHTGQIGVRLQAHQSPTPWCSQGTMCGTTMLAPSLIQRCTKPLCIRMNSCTGYQKTLVPCDLGRICVPLWALPPKRDMLRSGLTHCCCQPSCLASGTKGGETDCLRVQCVLIGKDQKRELKSPWEHSGAPQSWEHRAADCSARGWGC